MMRWKSSKIKAILEKVPNISLVDVGPQGSEMTTEQLVYAVHLANDKLYVRGFVTDHQNQLLQGDDVDVEMIEVSTGYSDGGDSREPQNVIARGLVHAALLDAGYGEVVRSLEPYF